MAKIATKKPGLSWPAEDHFAGWIPCASGHLSFSLFGKETHFSTANVSCQSSPPSRHIFIAQRRETHDLLLPSWLLRHVFRYHRVAADFYLIANTVAAIHPIQVGAEIKKFPDQLGCLTGSIYIVIDQKSSKLHHSRNRLYKNACRDAEATQAMYVNQDDPLGELAVFTAFPKALQDFRSDDATVLEFEFFAFRTGEIRIVPKNESFPADGYAGEPDAGREDYIRSMAAQAYYFAKDAGHRHYHHNSKQDNVLPVIAASSSDDDGWRRETMWSLVRAVLNARRRPNIEDFSRATGISAYAASFQSHLGGHRRTAANFEAFQPIDVTTEYDLTYLNASLGARREELSWERSSNVQFFNASLATLISMAALWLTAAQWVDSRTEDGSAYPQWLGGALQWFSASPQLVALLGIFGWMMYIRVQRNKFPFFQTLFGTLVEIIDNLYFSVTRGLHFILGRHGDALAATLRFIMYMSGFLFFGQLALGQSGIDLMSAVGQAVQSILDLGH